LSRARAIVPVDAAGDVDAVIAYLQTSKATAAK